MDTIEYSNGQEQFREDPDETVHWLILTFIIRMQKELITRVKDFIILTLSKHFSRQRFEIFSLIFSKKKEFDFMQTLLD